MELKQTALSRPCCIRKVREEFGILGNMSRHPISHNGLLWPTSEHLFQALRFPDDSPLQEKIRREKNPMKAKWAAKAARDEMVVSQLSSQDLRNMRLCLRLKIDQHEDVRTLLKQTGDRPIVEDCSNRARGSGLFWGASFDPISDTWTGQNWLGRLWEEIRSTQ